LHRRIVIEAAGPYGAGILWRRCRNLRHGLQDLAQVISLAGNTLARKLRLSLLLLRLYFTRGFALWGDGQQTLSKAGSLLGRNKRRRPLADTVLDSDQKLGW
jgi:hypothetical protein